MVSWCNKGAYNAQTSPKSELCGFKWANTHNKCVHDSAPPPPLRKHGRGPKTPGKTAVQRPPGA